MFIFVGLKLLFNTFSIGMRLINTNEGNFEGFTSKS